LKEYMPGVYEGTQDMIFLRGKIVVFEDEEHEG
jgi:hypothetical protein